MALPCDRFPGHGSVARPVLVATVAGHDTGATVLWQALASVPDHHMHGYAPGSEWVNLAEFAQRWILMHEKMTNPGHPDFTHFSQFISSERDGFSPEPDSTFRPLPELLRRKIKPAWYQLFNMTKTICGLRSVVMDAYNPGQKQTFGMLYAFRDSRHAADSQQSAAQYSAAQVLRSLDFFLQLFPQGKIIVHLPVSRALRVNQVEPTCACAGVDARCSTNARSSWPDYRRNMINKLLQYHESRSSILLTTADVDFRDLSSMTSRISSFLGLKTNRAFERRAGDSFERWSRKMRKMNILELPKGNIHALPVHACKASWLRRTDFADTNISWCPSFACESSTAEPVRRSSDNTQVRCIACPTTLADWSWSQLPR
jgi:hypothetical protein